MCTDLKQLYVCVTRPKKRLIIYDEDPDSRASIMKYWGKLDAVEVVTEDIMLEEKGEGDRGELMQRMRDGRKERDSEEKREGWKSQGV